MKTGKVKMKQDIASAIQNLAAAILLGLVSIAYALSNGTPQFYLGLFLAFLILGNLVTQGSKYYDLFFTKS